MWKLPDDFSPDCGISFQKHPTNDRIYPIGTNLFTAQQAEEMVKFMLEGLPDYVLMHENPAEDNLI